MKYKFFADRSFDDDGKNNDHDHDTEKKEQNTTKTTQKYPKTMGNHLTIQNGPKTFRKQSEKF